MKYEFEVYQMKVEGHIFWVAKSRILKGCVGQGETAHEAMKELEDNERDWLETAKSVQIPIPEERIRDDTIYSGKISLRISADVHRESALYAKENGISLNQYFSDAIAHYNGLHYGLRSGYPGVSSEAESNVIRFALSKQKASNDKEKRN